MANSGNDSVWPGLDGNAALELRQRLCTYAVRPQLSHRDGDEHVLARHAERAARLAGFVFAQVKGLARPRYDVHLSNGSTTTLQRRNVALTAIQLTQLIETNASRFMQGSLVGKIQNVDQKAKAIIAFCTAGVISPDAAARFSPSQAGIVPDGEAKRHADDILSFFFSSGQFFKDRRLHWGTPFSLSELAQLFKWHAIEAARGKSVSIAYFAGQSPLLSALNVPEVAPIVESIVAIAKHRGDVRLIYSSSDEENRSHVASLERQVGRSLGLPINHDPASQWSPNHQWLRASAGEERSLLMLRNFKDVPTDIRQDEPLTLSCSTDQEIDRFEAWLRAINP